MSASPIARAAQAPRSAVVREWNRSDRLLHVVCFALASGITVVALELWNARLNVPLWYRGDSIANGAHFKTLREQPWYEFQPMLGAPHGQVLHDFPTADNLHFLAAKLIAFVTPDWATGMNLYFLLGFPLAAASALWLLRRLEVSRAIAVSVAIVFAIAPYHFVRAENHLFLGSYYLLPLAIAIVIDVIRGTPIWAVRETGRRGLRWVTGRSLATIGILVVTASAQTYYAVFFLVLLAFAGIVRLISTRSWRPFLGAALAGAITAVVMLLNMAPDLAYTAEHGSNPIGFARSRSESEVYALKLTSLLLPWRSHRIEFFRELRASYDAHYPLPSESVALGAIAAAGFVALFLILAFMAATWGGTRARTLTATPRFRLLGQLAALTFVAFLFSTVGGLSTIVSFASSALRGWNRISIVIALLSLIAVAILVDAAIRALDTKLTRPGWRRVPAGAAAIILVGVAFIDQTPNAPTTTFTYAATIERFDADARWIASVEASVPDGSLILQLPHQPYPETLNPLGHFSTDSLIPYLQSDALRWTGGGIRGRPTADWPGMVGALRPEDLVRVAAASGAAGIHIDTWSTLEPELAALTTVLDDVAGPARRSEDGRWMFYDLSAVRAQLESEFTAAELQSFAETITDPVTVSATPSFVHGYGPDGMPRLTSTGPDPRLVLVSDRSEPTPVTLDLAVQVEDATARSVTVVLPDGSEHTISVEGGRAEAVLQFDVHAGVQEVHIALDDPAASAGFALTRFAVLNTSLDPLRAGVRP